MVQGLGFRVLYVLYRGYVCRTNRVYLGRVFYIRLKHLARAV